MFGLKEDILKKLRLPNDFKDCFRHPYPEKVDTRFLLKLSFKMPICNWLGANNFRTVQLARKFNIYDTGLKKIDGNDLMNLGFSGIDIGAEIERRQDEMVENILKNATKKVAKNFYHEVQ